MEPKRLWNPPNPYLTEHRELIGEPPVAELDIYEDHSKTILSHNDSPDIGFRWSVNPYRGCFHACAYCLHGETPILMADGTTKRLQDLRVGDSIYGTVRRGRYRRYTRTHVLAHWSTIKPAYRLTLTDGAQVIASADHRFLTRRGWKHLTGEENGRERRPHLTPHDQLLGVGTFHAPSLDWSQGFLAGIFDAEGSYSRGILRISNTDPTIIQQTTRCLSALQCDWVVDSGSDSKRASQIRVRGGLREHLRLFHAIDPVITRKRALEDMVIKNSPKLGIARIEPTGLHMELFDITTGTGDFIANGIVSHNCYARPTHEYFGFGAGTDFERKIFIKRNAPALLEQAFRRKSWQGERVVFSGVTDCYQPLEAAWQLTRGCLEVCRDFRNPVALITKSALVRRDVDVLAALAHEAQASVSISIAFLDEAIARLMDPGAPTIRKRFETMRLLADAGIPVGIGIAPIIPGLNDSDIPSLLRQAKRCGASYAFKTLLRLPGSVKEVFFHRLREALPLRAAKIEHRLREARDGALYDHRFGHRHHGSGAYWDVIEQQWQLWTKRLGFAGEDADEPPPSTFRRPPQRSPQLEFAWDAEDASTVVTDVEKPQSH